MLKLSPNIDDPDSFYQQLIDSQRDLSDIQAQMMNAKLILLLANHIGDNQVLGQALQIAKAELD